MLSDFPDKTKSANGQPLVYVGMSADVIHKGHLNIINVAASYGHVVVGVLTDRAIASYKRVPLMPFEERVEIVNAIKGVDRVISQETLDYRENLRALKPDFVVHGDDWKEGIQSETRKQVIETLAEWGGELIEPQYTDGVSSTNYQETIKSRGITPDARLKSFRKILNSKEFIRIIEVHNGLTGSIVEHVKIQKDGRILEFDGMWGSSHTDAASRAIADLGAIDLSSRLEMVHQVFEVTTKPLIFDGNTGGRKEHFVLNVRTLERHGVSGVVVEDKKSLKGDASVSNAPEEVLEDCRVFAEKISSGKASQRTEEFMIIAKTEILAGKNGVKEALARTRTYLEAGADGIMVASSSKDTDQLYDFCLKYKMNESGKPLIVASSSFPCVRESELIKNGVNVLIYSDHLIRAAVPAMNAALCNILEGKGTNESDMNMMDLPNIFDLFSEKL